MPQGFKVTTYISGIPQFPPRQTCREKITTIPSLSPTTLLYLHGSFQLTNLAAK